MSKERELLKKWMKDCMWRGSNMSLLEETKELLAQPEQTEQEPVVWQVIGIAGFMYVYNKPRDQVYEHHTVNALYLAPPKREPLTPQQISVGNQSMLNVTRDAFVKGVKFAEKCHDIGGKE